MKKVITSNLNTHFLFKNDPLKQIYVFKEKTNKNYDIGYVYKNPKKLNFEYIEIAFINYKLFDDYFTCHVYGYKGKIGYSEVKFNYNDIEILKYN